jgi:hypothetical protein
VITDGNSIHRNRTIMIKFAAIIAAAQAARANSAAAAAAARRELVHCLVY